MDADARSRMDRMTSQHLVTLSLLIATLGVVATVLGSHQHGWKGALLANLGNALIATGAVSFLWNMLAEKWVRAARDENISSLYRLLESKMQSTQEAFLRTHYELAEGSQSFGLTNLMNHRLPGGEVRSALAHSARFLMVCIIDGDWRDRYFDDLVSFLRQGSSVDALIPDPDDSRLMDEIAVRFRRSAARDVEALRDSLVEIRDTARVGHPGCGELTVHLLRTIPSYTCYLFEGAEGERLSNFGMLRLYGNLLRSGNRFPALKFVKTGTIWHFVTRDIEAVTNDQNFVTLKLASDNETSPPDQLPPTPAGINAPA
jgi:hypothetical protein